MVTGSYPLTTCRLEILGFLISQPEAKTASEILDHKTIKKYPKSTVFRELEILTNQSKLNLVEKTESGYKIKKNHLGSEAHRFLNQLALSVHSDEEIFEIGKSFVTYTELPDMNFNFDVSLVSSKLEKINPDMFKLPFEEVFEDGTRWDTVKELTKLHKEMWDIFDSLPCGDELKELQKKIYEKEQKLSLQSEFIGFKNVISKMMISRAFAIQMNNIETGEISPNDPDLVKEMREQILKDSFKIVITINKSG